MTSCWIVAIVLIFARYKAEWLARNAFIIETPWMFNEEYEGFGGIPGLILVSNGLDLKTIRHEQAHQYQLWRGFIFITAIRYSWQLLWWGYYAAPLEQKARAYARRSLPLNRTY